MTPLQWDTNLRGSLVLWPGVSHNIAVLVGFDGVIYDEDEFVKAMDRGSGKTPTDPRAVRNTFEVLAYSGIALRDPGGHLRLTPLGRCVMTFLGVAGPRTFVTTANRRLPAVLLVRALSQIAEIQAIWRLWLLTDNRLTNEELNRGIGAIADLDDVSSVAARVLDARAMGDVTLIGPRFYRDEDYGTAKENDQRKAMWPQFLLASCGGLLLADDGTQDRILPGWASDLLSSALRSRGPFRQMTTSAEHVFAASRQAMPPRCD